MRIRALLPLLGLALLVLPCRAQSIDVPRGTGWVNDTARVLPAGEVAALESRLAAFEQKNGHELALLTVPTTSGQPIENYALAVAREWKLGKPGKNDGALLVVAVQDRKLRIEVGRGLEGELTDLICGRIIRDVMVPRFKQGDMPGGIRAGVEANHIRCGTFDRNVTVSLGVAQRGPGITTMSALIKSADEAVYLAKDAGRNQVCAAVVPSARSKSA